MTAVRSGIQYGDGEAIFMTALGNFFPQVLHRCGPDSWRAVVSPPAQLSGFFAGSGMQTKKALHGRKGEHPGATYRHACHQRRIRSARMD